MGQLKPIETETGAPQWAADQARTKRAGGERGYVRCERRSEGDAMEAVAFTPAGTPARVQSAYSWPRLIRYNFLFYGFITKKTTI